MIPLSSLPGALWPAVPHPDNAMLLSILGQLQETQWWTPEKLRHHQFIQLTELLRHAHESVPYYGQILSSLNLEGVPLDLDIWNSIPLLERHQIQRYADQLISSAIPSAHGEIDVIQTTGSTGEPIRVTRTALNDLMWKAFTLRDHVWHDRDLSQKLAALRDSDDPDAAYPNGLQGNGWGDSARVFAPHGTAALLQMKTPSEQQLEWLVRQDPTYIITFPSNLYAVLTQARQKSVKLPNLKSVMTLSEVVYPELRDLCQDVWGVVIQDMYSSREAGYLALQCPETEHYHVQSEGVLLEVLDDDGRACEPGQVGRVVVTNLANFAMPLIRYVIGDYAEVGEPCSCGRGLPVLKQIMGRVHNVIMLPSGDRHFPQTTKYGLSEIAPIRQFKLIQKSLKRLELHLSVYRSLSLEEEENLRRTLVDKIGHPFDVDVLYCDEIVAGPGGKHQFFVAEMPVV